MKSPKRLYEDADREELKLKKYTVAEFNRMATLPHFDELNVTRGTEEVIRVYKRINKRAKKCFRDIGWAAIDEGLYELDIDRPKRPDADDVVKEQLSAYNPITKYIYNDEMVRKAERCREGVVASGGRQDLRKTLATNLRYLLMQEVQYGDCVVDAARLETFKANGVTEVRWVTERDNRVCEECVALNGVIFPVDRVPPKPHYNCRCHLEPVMD